MTQVTTGVRSVLSDARVYEAFQRLVGAEGGRRRFVADHVRARPGDRVLDLGCGPGDLLPHLGEVAYVGVDLSEAYVERARERFGARAAFHVGDATRPDAALTGPFDLVVAIGVLHHLDDAGVRRMLAFAAGVLAPQGRMVTVDPAFADGQPRAARFVISHDRGQHVRDPGAYEALARTAFGSVTATVRSDLLHIPYSHCVVESSDPAPKP